MNRSIFLILAVSFIAVASSVAPAQKAPTIFLAGDSTCAAKDESKRPETGWGEMLGKHFRTGTVTIDNRAANGRSTKSFIAEKRWDQLVADLSKGDFVFIQFGHNDASKEKGERYATPEQFRANLIKFVDDVRSLKAVPVLLTPVVRRRFDADGKFYDTHGEYPDLTRSVAKDLKVILIDMHGESMSIVKQRGPEASKELFLHVRKGENSNYQNGIEDNTHFSPIGANVLANVVVEQIRTKLPKLRKYLNK